MIQFIAYCVFLLMKNLQCKYLEGCKTCLDKHRLSFSEYCNWDSEALEGSGDKRTCLHH